MPGLKCTELCRRVLAKLALALQRAVQHRALREEVKHGASALLRRRLYAAAVSALSHPSFLTVAGAA